MWLEQRREEKTVVPQFHGAWLAVDSACAHAESGGVKLLLVVLIHAVVAVILLCAVLAAANRMKERARQDREPFLAGRLGTVGAPMWENAGQRRDDAV